MDVLYVIEQHPITFLAIFLVFFAVLLVLFARSRIFRFLRGFGRTLASLIFAPFVYTQSAICEIADCSGQKEIALAKSRRYLISKLLVIFQLVLIISALTVLASSVTYGWYRMVPSKELLEQISTLDEEYSAAIEQLGPEYKRLQQEWIPFVTQYTQERRAVIDSTDRVNALIANQIGGEFRHLVWEEGPYRIYRGHDSPQDFFDEALIKWRSNRSSYDPTPTQETESLLRAFTENQFKKALAESEISVGWLESLRGERQSVYASIKDTAGTLLERVSVLEPELRQLRERAGWDYEEFLFSVLIGLGTFMLFIWIAGLIIEALRLGVDMASDTARIKEKIEAETDTTQNKASV